MNNEFLSVVLANNLFKEIYNNYRLKQECCSVNYFVTNINQKHSFLAKKSQNVQYPTAMMIQHPTSNIQHPTSYKSLVFDDEADE